MPLKSSLRSRWARRFSLIAIVCAIIYWAERQFNTASLTKKLPTAADEGTIELQPSLTVAREIATATTSNATQTSQTGWDPQPQWRHELNGSWGAIPKSGSASLGSASTIPEEYPLEPRFKKGPPVVGNAIADSSLSRNSLQADRIISQPRMSQMPVSRLNPATGQPPKPDPSDALASASPFRSLPNSSHVTGEPSPLESHQLAGQSQPSRATFGSPPTTWPDQSYAMQPNHMPDIQVDSSPAFIHPTPPNLLTNARLANPPAPSRHQGQLPDASSPVKHSTPQYIVQPKRL